MVGLLVNSESTTTHVPFLKSRKPHDATIAKSRLGHKLQGHFEAVIYTSIRMSNFHRPFPFCTLLFSTFYSFHLLFVRLGLLCRSVRFFVMFLLFLKRVGQFCFSLGTSIA